MTEENITRTIMNFLLQNGWEIIAFDFPQSGTGYQLHPDNTTDKTAGIIIPDIIAVKNNTALVFENKDRFVREDFTKLDKLRSSSVYGSAWHYIFGNREITSKLYCIGMPDSISNREKTQSVAHLVDFTFFIESLDKVNPVPSFII